jgi:hypothetical protein
MEGTERQTTAGLEVVYARLRKKEAKEDVLKRGHAFM